MYVEGLARWNEGRAAAALQQQQSPLRSFDFHLRHVANQLGNEILGHDLIDIALHPSQYTGEKIGVQYLLAQNDMPMLPDELTPDVEQDIDEGFGDDAEDDVQDETQNKTEMDLQFVTQQIDELVATPLAAKIIKVK